MTRELRNEELAGVFFSIISIIGVIIIFFNPSVIIQPSELECTSNSAMPSFALPFFSVDKNSPTCQKFAAEKKLRDEENRIQAEASAKAEAERISKLPPCVYKVVSKPVYSLERQNEITGQNKGQSSGHVSGSFILGFGGVYGSSTGSITGSIGEITKYYFYTSTNDGGYVLDTTSGSTPLYERDDLSPALYSVKSPANLGFEGHPDCKGFKLEGNESINFEPIFRNPCEIQRSNGYDTWTFRYSEFDKNANGDLLRECLSFQNPQKLVVPIGTVRKEYRPN